MIKQKNYGTIEIDNREKDIIEIWCNQRVSCNVVQVERKNINRLIKQLQKTLTHGK